MMGNKEELLLWFTYFLIKSQKEVVLKYQANYYKFLKNNSLFWIQRWFKQKGKQKMG